MKQFSKEQKEIIAKNLLILPNLTLILSSSARTRDKLGEGRPQELGLARKLSQGEDKIEKKKTLEHIFQLLCSLNHELSSYELIIKHIFIIRKRRHCYMPSEILKKIKKQTGKLITILGKLIDTYKIPPLGIYNMDETGISTERNKSPKVISTKGKRCVNKAYDRQCVTRPSVRFTVRIE